MFVAAHANKAKFIALCFFCVSCSSNRDFITGRPTINTYSVSEDVEIGTRYATLLIASSEAQGYTIDPANIYTQTVRTVASRILAVPENRARMPPFPWEIRVVGMSEPNAWCFAGGQILVLAGLMEAGIVRDEDELAAIMGHEMAHAAARHATEKMTFDTLRAWTAPFGQFIGSRMIALRTNSELKEVVRALTRSSDTYGQSQELEADIIGLEFMARAGYSPNKALQIWRRLANQEKDLVNSGVGKTHPNYAVRLRELEKHLPVAQWLTKKRTTSVPGWLPKTGWTFDSFAVNSTVTQASLSSQGGLPTGAQVGSIYQRGHGHLLDVKIQLHTNELGQGPRLAVTLRAGRDLVESGLPVTIVMKTQRLHPTSKVELRRSYLARQVPLTSEIIPMRVAIPAYPPGRYRIVVQALVGSLLSETSHRYDVLDI